MSPFALFVARVGIAEAARRLGVTPRTIRRWALDGVSTRYQEKAAKAVARHLGSIRAAEGRRRKRQEEYGVDLPPQTELTPVQVLPARGPNNRELKKALRIEGATLSHTEVISSAYSVGETKWFTTGKTILDIDADELYRITIDTWESSYPKRQYVSVKFLFFRYIPFNPIYKGEMIRKQGTWVENWISTKATSSRRRIKDYIAYWVDHAQRWAQTRVIFLEMIGVRMIDRRHEE